MQNLIFAFNTVTPLFILILIGIVLNKFKFLNEDYFKASNKLVFRIALPASIFSSLYKVDFNKIFDIGLIGFGIMGTLATFLAVTAGALLFIKDRHKIGAFVQGSFRSNYVMLGIPYVKNLLDSSDTVALAKSSLIVAFVVPLYNILAVIILAAFSNSGKVSPHMY